MSSLSEHQYSDGAVADHDHSNDTSTVTENYNKFIQLSEQKPISYFVKHEIAIRGLATSLQMIIQTYLLTVSNVISLFGSTITNSELFRDIFKKVFFGGLTITRWLTYVQYKNIWTLDIHVIPSPIPDELNDHIKTLFQETLEEFTAEMEAESIDNNT